MQKFTISRDDVPKAQIRGYSLRIEHFLLE
jgi:hypothetical protein